MTLAHDRKRWAEMPPAARRLALHRLEQREDEQEMLQLLQSIQHALETASTAQQIKYALECIEPSLGKLELWLHAYCQNRLKA